MSETQTSAKYNAYAAVAQREKKPGVAHLFAAASQAEAIHASNHLAVLKQLGVNQPRAGSFPGAAGPSVENLQDAWQSEAFEVAVAYPVMVAVARQENQSYALHSFRYALATELLHEVLFQAALVRLVKGYPDPSTRCPICKVGTFARLT